MHIDFAVRLAELADAPSMAKVHVDTWRETYRGLMSDAMLDDPALLSWRKQFWAAALTDLRYESNAVAVAFREGSLIGIAMSDPCLDGDEGLPQLYLLYVFAEFHGSGVGEALLNTMLDRALPAALWSPIRTHGRKLSTRSRAS